MKKLSELANDTMLCLGDIEYGTFLTKEEIIKQYGSDKETIESIVLHTVKKSHLTFDWRDVLEMISEDRTYASHDEDVYFEILKNSVFEKAKSELNLILANHPTFWEDEEVEYDLQLTEMQAWKEGDL